MGMTPERIAEDRKEAQAILDMLREPSLVRTWAERWMAALDEIERLRGLMLRTHERVTWGFYNHGLTTAECTCGRLCKSHVYPEEADALFAAHVAEILDGGAG